MRGKEREMSDGGGWGGEEKRKRWQKRGIKVRKQRKRGKNNWTAP